MNTRARVKAIPAVIAASMGIGVLTRLEGVMAHDGHNHTVASLQPESFETIEVTINDGYVESGDGGITQIPYGVEPTPPDNLHRTRKHRWQFRRRCLCVFDDLRCGTYCMRI